MSRTITETAISAVLARTARALEDAAAALLPGDEPPPAVFEAPNPWGPWSVIYYSNISPANGGSGGWGNLGSGTWNGSSFDDADTLGIRVTNAWTSADGKSTWMVFSSNGVAPPNSSFAALAGNWMDSFNAVELTLVTP